jgi:hypothetical protein
MQTNETIRHNCFVERRDKIEAALVRLQSLKSQIAALRLQCEALKKRQSEQRVEGLVCSECGKRIVLGEEVLLKDSFGEVKRFYHKECFKRIWLSQSWVFDYSSPGFLRSSGEGL